MLRRVLILADDSAHWKIAGLRQLERLVMELNELTTARAESAQVCILWPPDFPPERRFVPQNPRLSVLDLATTPPESPHLMLSTRLFLYRNSPAIASRFAAESSKYEDRPQNFSQRVADIRAAWQESNPGDGWEFLEDAGKIAACEKRFLRGSGKSQDGLVSRFINRPISRAISRLLLRTPITPGAWTLAIFVLPLIGAAFLARGYYASVIAGMLLFQLYSILDGCDGEIARAKYLESRRGGQLDNWCDILGSLLLVVSLGYGLSLQPAATLFLFFESIIVAILITVNELLLVSKTQIMGKGNSALYPRHQWMIEGSGLSFLNERLVGWLIQLTKRDMALLAFLLLAIANRPVWILHLSGTVAAISSLLALKSFAHARASSQAGR
jgi:phosphatidylglycerophosphate synthase